MNDEQRVEKYPLKLNLVERSLIGKSFLCQLPLKEKKNWNIPVVEIAAV